MTATTMTEAAAAFLAAVRDELADLPADDAAELLEDVEAHLAEADADGRLTDLGTPQQYAADLRAAAGLPERARAHDRWAPVRAARRLYARVAATRAYTEVRAFLPELRPAWWVVRGYLLVVALSHATSRSVRLAVPFPHLSDSALLGLAAVCAAVAASVAWGRRHRTYAGWQRALLTAASVLAVISAVAVTEEMRSGGYGGEYYYTSVPQGVVGPYGQISEIYPFGPDNQPLADVRLYDQFGNPVANMVCDVNCPRLSFPLYDGSPDWLPDEPVPTATPTPEATPTPKPKPTPKATPTLKP
jgi:hypothetical protein